MSNNKDIIFDSASLEQLNKDFDFSTENTEEPNQAMPTRASVKRKFSNLDEKSMQEVQTAIETLDDQLGATNTNLRYLTQNEVDSLIDELLAVRKVNDILSSREDTLKNFAKSVISLDQIEPDKTNGELISPMRKLKISKEIRGGKLSIDIDLLKKRLTGEQFSMVTNKVTTIIETTTPDGKMDEVITTSYTVNEKFLEAEMVKGNILSEDIFLSSVESKRTSAIYIRDLEN
jgi:hypothetical protein